jgi:hypothetical protein
MRHCVLDQAKVSPVVFSVYGESHGILQRTEKAQEPSQKLVTHKLETEEEEYRILRSLQ